MGTEVGNLFYIFIFSLWTTDLKNDAVPLIILEDHKEIISNKESDNVKHQGQVIRFRSIVNTSQVLFYFPLLKRSRVIFLLKILNAFYLNNDNGK